MSEADKTPFLSRPVPYGLAILLTCVAVLVVSAILFHPTLWYALRALVVDDPVWDAKPASYWRDKMTDPDPSARYKAILVLGHYAGHDDMPLLVAALEDDVAHNRGNAARSLSWHAERAKEATPALCKLSKDKDSRVRLEVIRALRAIRPDDEAAYRVMGAALKDDEPLVREAALLALIDSGPKAKSAIPVLVEALRDPSQWVRQAANEALREIDPKAAARN